MSKANDFPFSKDIAKAFFNDGDGTTRAPTNYVQIPSLSPNQALKQGLASPIINNRDDKANIVKDSHRNSLGNDQKPRDVQFQNLVKEVYKEFADRERQFFLNLPTPELRKLCNGNDPDPMYPTCHLRHEMEILLTLKGVKPCTLVVHYTAQEIYTQMVKECLKPVVDKFQLSYFGFTLQQITHPMPTTIHRGFQDGWVFADMRSPTWAAVKQLFLIPSKGKTDEIKIGKALGYPLEHGNRTVTYINATEHDILEKITGKEVCCVPGFEYTCKVGTEKDWDIVNLHFLWCVKAAEEAGVRLTLDIEEFPELEKWFEKQWSTTK